jgi:hypothetical protein
MVFLRLIGKHILTIVSQRDVCQSNAKNTNSLLSKPERDYALFPKKWEEKSSWPLSSAFTHTFVLKKQWVSRVHCLEDLLPKTLNEGGFKSAGIKGLLPISSAFKEI